MRAKKRREPRGNDCVGFVSFRHLGYPGYEETTPTSQTVDTYMAHLRSIIQEGSPENAGLIAAARDIISRINYSA